MLIDKTFEYRATRIQMVTAHRGGCSLKVMITETSEKNKHLNSKLLLVRYSDVRYSNGNGIRDHLAVGQLLTIKIPD